MHQSNDEEMQDLITFELKLFLILLFNKLLNATFRHNYELTHITFIIVDVLCSKDAYLSYLCFIGKSLESVKYCLDTVEIWR